MKILACSRTNFAVSNKIANKVASQTGVAIQVHDDYHKGVYYEISEDTDELDFQYVKGYLHAIEQVMVDMFQ